MNVLPFVVMILTLIHCAHLLTSPSVSYLLGNRLLCLCLCLDPPIRSITVHKLHGCNQPIQYKLAGANQPSWI